MKLYGKNPVLERIKAAPETIKKLYLQKRTDLSAIVRAAKEAGVHFESVTKAQLEDFSGGGHTQGVVAEIKEFEYSPFSLVLKECKNNVSVPVFLDGIQDPQNLGAIIRNLACLGGFSIVLAEHESASVNETVLRVASGGENYVKIAKVSNIATTLTRIKKEDVKIVGAETCGGKAISEVEFVNPLAIVIGREGKGIRPGIKKCLDTAVSLPMYGAPLSYNVTVGTMLFCYEVARAARR